MTKAVLFGRYLMQLLLNHIWRAEEIRLNYRYVQ